MKDELQDKSTMKHIAHQIEDEWFCWDCAENVGLPSVTCKQKLENFRCSCELKDNSILAIIKHGLDKQCSHRIYAKWSLFRTLQEGVRYGLRSQIG